MASSPAYLQLADAERDDQFNLPQHSCVKPRVNPKTALAPGSRPMRKSVDLAGARRGRDLWRLDQDTAAHRAAPR
jgi:hypothetical protein